MPSMYDASIPVFIRTFRNLLAILDKGEAFAKEKGLDPQELTEARLIQDMDPLTTQIQRASDTAKGVGGRLSGNPAPSYEDNEKTFADMRARIEKTIKYLESVPREGIDGTEDKTVQLKTRSRAASLSGQDYLFSFALPNFYFHVTTAYDILRAQGVQIKKMDYIGDL
jgi:uncharacterized protein